MLPLTFLAALHPVPAYIGPGAGFALGGSFLFALAGILLALLALLLWPARLAIRSLRGRGRRKGARARRVVVLGLDGLDPVLTRRWLDEGQLPHLDALRREGGFRPLGTTWPAMSPVGWSTFATGVDASGHNIFDFLTRDRLTHLPTLSSTRLRRAPARKIGPFTLPGGGHPFESLKRSKPFWTTCAEAGVATSILRVPITFPPDRFGGKLLSAMCVPDLRGTQGTFTEFREPAATGTAETAMTTGGVRLLLERDGDAFTGRLPGPDAPDGSGPLTVAVTVAVDRAASRARFTLAGRSFTIGADEYSDWIPVAFGRGSQQAHGICRVRVTAFAPRFTFYVTPLHIDPAKPAVPISNPPHLAMALAKLHGSYATLGLAEDTWALNERVIDEQAFLEQAYAIHEERRRQFLHALDRTPEGVVSVVFDATDRIQHMFFRYLDPEHPANRGKDIEKHKDAILDLYRRADALVGETRAKLRKGDVLLVASDHGFKQFQRGVNLNAWFRGNGYLYLKGDPADGPLPAIPEGRRFEVGDVDWPRTRAYTNGLAGFYLNVKGREHDGCVEPAQVATLKREIIDRLRGLPDPGRGGQEAITELWAGEDVYHGPYRENGPDVIVGYKPGYRADWDAAVGAVSGVVISDNTRSWSGDHCMDPRQVPGVLFSSLPFAAGKPNLVDLAPTVLDLLGLPRPAHMTGRSIFSGDGEAA
ncbi:MAG: alkaline phosphatase family protein [bacterium]|jgi:predicted AlkP superfamily phosphohydrolase/phosphomutase|nr:alkaline phosphatase family protein [bacterium]MBK9777297.1 alkaline phosphatase family protein [bacterium]